MLCRKVVAVFAFCVVGIVNGMPQGSDGSSQDSSAGLPFIQFTNGGIRFNFGGYHAEAGLGGLLGGGRTGGGLHASAGTPWGAHAGAGLGGILGGDNANAGGGLYARAGLGNGRHEAAAGLGGLLDGSGRSGSPASGGLFAGATTGTHGVGVSTGTGSNGPASSDAQNGANNTQSGEKSDGGKPVRGRTNIQIITRSGKKPQKIKQIVSEVSGSTDAPKPTDSPANKEVRETQSAQPVPVASASIFGTLSANPVPQAPVIHSIEKVKIIGGAIEQAPPVPPVPPLPNEANEVVENRPTIVTQRVRIVRPIVRKRFWGPRKQVILDYVPSIEAGDAVNSNTQKRQATNYADNTPASRNYEPVQTNRNNDFFDDVFKIPVSTLNAVNQLLNNNSG